MVLLNDDEWGRWSTVRIAEVCGVSDEFVRKMKLSLPTVGSESKYINRYGNVATMNTERIGCSRLSAFFKEFSLHRVRKTFGKMVWQVWRVGL